jgi:large subunit ribosomal protein L7e
MKSNNSDLHLVPETLLKRRHDLDALRAQRAASSLTRSISRKRVSDKSKVVRIIKPETIITRARSKRNGTARFNRVSKKGMMKRASNAIVVGRRVWDGVKDEEVAEEVTRTGGNGNAMDDEEDKDNEGGGDARKERASLHEIPYKANSVGSSVVFAILVRPIAHATPKPARRTLASLRLRRVNEGVFLRYDARTRKMLHLVEDHVLYGPPSVETVSDLVRRRGHCNVEGKRVPLADNNVVERELGESLGLICVDDLVQVLTSATGDEEEEWGGEGTVFGKVAKFLWPFRLTSRKSKFQRRTLDLKEGKLYGDRGEAINGYIREML